MGKQISLRSTLTENVNKGFRLGTKWYHIIHRDKEVKNYPVIINNYNRLEYLQQQVEWLLSVGQRNLHIIDNASDYEPLLKYYKKINATVYLLDKNTGHEAFWKTHLFARFGKYFHVYTDPDLLPDENTPTDFMYYFKSLLDKYPGIKKVGFGLRTDDIPDHYTAKAEVIKWENGLLHTEIEPNVYKAPIDTTFALYRPYAFMQCWNESLRTGAPYLLRHMPWYEDSAHPNMETMHYLRTAGAASSWYKTVLKEDNRYKK